MKSNPGSDATVTLGVGVVTIKRTASSSPVVANILGMDCDETGNPVKLWLDRLVHGAHESWLGEWQVSGAILSVFSANRAEG